MNCMKCGKQIQEGSVFCDACLEDMANYPVPPGTPVQLPNRKNIPEERTVQPRKKPLSAEEQISQLRMHIRWLRLGLVLLLLLLTLVSLALLHTLELGTSEDDIGKNYSTVASTAPHVTE